MPELPEVEVLRRSLLPHLIGARVDAVEVRHSGLREPVDETALRHASAGRRVVGLRRRSKYLLIDFGPREPASPSLSLSGTDAPSPPMTVVIHLGMSGRLTLVPRSTPLEPHEHVAFLLGDRRLRFRDPRRFGLVLALPTAALAKDPHFAALGPEPLGEAAGESLRGPRLRQAAAGRRAPVKAFLMDSRVVVGVGNIYANEACHLAGVHPLRGVHRLAAARFDRLAEAVVTVLERAITQGGTTLNDFADGAGNAGYFQVELAVYDRAGEPCPRCGALIRRSVVAGRSTYWCGRCQR